MDNSIATAPDIPHLMRAWARYQHHIATDDSLGWSDKSPIYNAHSAPANAKHSHVLAGQVDAQRPIEARIVNVALSRASEQFPAITMLIKLYYLRGAEKVSAVYKLELTEVGEIVERLEKSLMPFFRRACGTTTHESP